MRDRIQLLRLALALLSLWLAFGNVVPVGASPDGVVQVIFFYSPTCSHCQLVKTEVFPVLEAQHGDRLVIAHLDTTQPQGAALFQAALDRYQPAVVGVPTVVIGDSVLVGSVEIPQMLPGLIESHLAIGGVGWPDLPGMEDALADLDISGSVSLRERFMYDPLGNAVSTIVLAALLVSVVMVIKPRPWQKRLAARLPDWVMVVVLLIGLTAAVYLTYVETTGVEAVCGPVGDCNTVQQSEYALLFGFLPLALVGVGGYLTILGIYVYNTCIGSGSDLLHAVTFLLSLFGLAVSVLLTYLQPFVIGATCAWCLTSAVSMMLDTLISSGRGWPAVEKELPALAKLVRPSRKKRYASASRRRRSAQRYG